MSVGNEEALRPYGVFYADIFQNAKKIIGDQSISRQLTYPHVSNHALEFNFLPSY
jgi:hypothetical protein